MASKLNISEIESTTGTVKISGDISLDLSQNTDFLEIPAGTSDQRGNPSEGAIRWNLDINRLEFYDGSKWKQVNLNYYGNEEIAAKENLILHLDPSLSDCYPGSGNRLYDLSGRGNHATLSGGPTFSTDNNGIFNFDGGNDFVNVSNASIYRNLNIFTVCGWFKVDVESYKTLVGYSSGSQGWNFLSTPSGTLHCRIDTNTNANQYGSGDGGTLTDNVWRYCCISLDLVSGVVEERIFYNQGQKQGVSGIAGSFSASGSDALRIMGPALGTGYTAGSWGHVTIYNKVLSRSEILQNYNVTKSRFGY